MSCDTDFYNQIGKYCKKICRDKQTYFSNQNCLNCHRSCKTCSSFESFDCATCFPGLTFIEASTFILPPNVTPVNPVPVCTNKCCLECPFHCHKCIPTELYDPVSKDILLNTPITCVQCDDGYALTSPNTCTLVQDISTKIDILNYYYKQQPPTLIFIFSHKFPFRSLNNTYTLSFLGGLKVGDDSANENNNNPNLKRMLKGQATIQLEGFDSNADIQDGPVWNKTLAFRLDRELENTSTNSEFHANIQKGNGVDQQCVLTKYSNKLECSINFGDSIVTNGSFRLDLINIGVTSMSGVEFYGRDDLREKYKSRKRDEMNLPQEEIKGVVMEGQWFVNGIEYEQLETEIGLAFTLSYAMAIPLYGFIIIGILIGAEDAAYYLIRLLSIMNVLFLTEIDYGRPTEEFMSRIRKSWWTLLWNPLKDLIVIPCSLIRRYNDFGLTCLYLDNFGGFVLVFFVVMVAFFVKFAMTRRIVSKIEQGKDIKTLHKMVRRSELILNKHFAHKILKFTFLDLVLYSLIQIKSFGYITTYHILNCLIGVVSLSLPIAFMVITQYRWNLRKEKV